MNYFLKSCAMITIILLSTSFRAISQSSDTSRHEKLRKNIIKLNLSSGLLYKNSPLIEYERIIKKNQSMSLQFGLVSLPFSSERISNSLQLNSAVNKKGYTFTLDYRFYLPKENKDPAPHGIYLGPYFSVYHFENENNMTVTDANDVQQAIQLKTNLNIVNIGAQLGYQFTLGKRWTIDCILLGPSLTNYKGKMQLLGNLDAINTDETLQEILKALAAKYPGVGTLLEGQIVEFKGDMNSWSAGFRYSMHVGFRF